MEIRATTLPIVNPVAPNIVNSGDSVLLVASLTEGATAGISYTWHSSLHGTTWTTTADSTYVVYPSAGTDTLTVVASNSYGADTAVAVLTVIDNTTYIETFEDVAIGSLPAGWSYYWNGSNAAYAPHVIAPGGYQYLSGLPDHALLMLAGSSSGYGDRAEVMLPVYTDSLHHFSMAFDYRCESSNQGTLEVGYYNGSSFTVVQSMTSHTGSYQHATVNFATASVPHTPITFRWNCSSVWYAVVIDNVEVHSDQALVIDTIGFDTISPLPAECTPSGLPWWETFTDGDDCWYKPTGSMWLDVIPYNDPYYESQRYLYLNTGRDALGSWIMSKEIQIPADTTLQPILSWRVSSSNGNYHHHYTVLVTDATVFTNPANYTVIYDDNVNHPNWSNWDTVSISLSQYVGHNIHIAFHNYPDLMQDADNGLLIDDVKITVPNMPIVSVENPGSVFRGDSLTVEATLVEGSAAGLSYTWHSTLMDTTWVDTLHATTSTFQFVYDTAGTDTITVVATNAYGTDSAATEVHITDCTIRTLPYTEDLEGVTAVIYYTRGYLPTCWYYNWNANSETRAPHVIPPTDYIFIDHRPNNAILIQAGDPTTGLDTIAEVILPPFAYNLQHLSLAFDYQHESTSNGTLYAGYYNDTVFNVVKTLTPYTGNSGNCYRRDTVSFATATVPDALITLRWSYSGTSFYCVAIDNIEVFHDSTAVIDTTPVPPDTVWRTVTVSSNVAGVCETYGSGQYQDGDTVEIGYTMIDTTTVGGHWQILGWSDGETGNPRQIVVTSDNAIIALFQWVADSVGIPELRTPNSEMTIYPNPAHGNVTIIVSKPTTLTVMDINDSVVIPTTHITSDLRLSTSDLPSGVYFVRFGEAVKKLVVR